VVLHQTRWKGDLAERLRLFAPIGTDRIGSAQRDSSVSENFRIPFGSEAKLTENAGHSRYESPMCLVLQRGTLLACLPRKGQI
jgi:hypothetical protein